MSKQLSQSLSAGGDAVGNVQLAGDNNQTNVRITQTRVSLPAADSVDMAEEMAALRAILAPLGGEDQSKVANALADAEAELAKPEPDRDEVGDALDRAVRYARKSGEFADAVADLVPHVTKAVAWLGTAGAALMAAFGHVA